MSSDGERRRSTRKRKSPDMYINAEEQPPARRPRRNDCSTRAPITFTGPLDAKRHFSPNEFLIMDRAHNMVNELRQRSGPWKDKLHYLARFAIEKENELRRQDPQHDGDLALSPTELVDQAWTALQYHWTDGSDTRIKWGQATAFATCGTLDQQPRRHFPVICFCDCFMANDCLNDGTVDIDSILNTPIGRETLLLLFRKIKHEFTRIVHRFLDIHFRGVFKGDGEILTPEKYTPRSQKDRDHPVPEVGDHDEEEDSGGPILPRRHYWKLSRRNHLCLVIDGRFLKLNDDHVNALLNLDLYCDEVTDMKHNNIVWSYKDCRAFRRRVFSTEFLLQNDSNPTTRATGSGRGDASRRSSPATQRTPNTNRARPALWRVHFGKIYVPSSPDRNIVSRSSSPDRMSLQSGV